MKKTILVFIILLFAFSAVAQSKQKTKKWDAIVRGAHLNKRALLHDVTDSSLILLLHNKRTLEISFDEIRKIKLKPHNTLLPALIVATSFVVGGTAGGVIIGNSMSKKRTGEPAALAGTVGGIAGGLVVGVSSAVISGVLYDKLASRKIYVHHDSISYQALKVRLKPYCLVQ